MSLFEKKFCSVCGSKIGLFGNRKLEDGNLCKECAEKLSYWFGDRKHSTVEQIKEQLAYREENLKKVLAFHTTKSYGRVSLVCLDEDAKRFMVQRTNNAASENPDVLEYSDVTGVDLDVDENRSEMTTLGPDNKQVSYNPPRYRYSYNFNVIIRVDNPYFNEMSVRLNPSPVIIEPEITPGGKQHFFPLGNPEYLQYDKMGKEIIKALTNAKQSAEEAAKPKKPVVCPHCEATTVPDENGRCEYCGSAIE